MGMIEVAGATRPRPGEQRCGDAWLHLDLGDASLLAIVDGLGHGPEAAAAASAALGSLREQIA